MTRFLSLLGPKTNDNWIGTADGSSGTVRRQLHPCWFVDAKLTWVLITLVENLITSVSLFAFSRLFHLSYRPQ